MDTQVAGSSVSAWFKSGSAYILLCGLALYIAFAEIWGTSNVALTIRVKSFD